MYICVQRDIYIYIISDKYLKRWATKFDFSKTRPPTITDYEMYLAVSEKSRVYWFLLAGPPALVLQPL